jgi:hypothetical protein
MEVLSHLNNLQNYAVSLKDTRLSSIKHPTEFFNVRQISRPKDMQEYMKRASYNMSVLCTSQTRDLLVSQLAFTAPALLSSPDVGLTATPLTVQPILLCQLCHRRGPPRRLLIHDQSHSCFCPRFPHRWLFGHWAIW